MKRKLKKASIATGILAITYTVMILYFEYAYVNNSTGANVYKIIRFTKKGARMSVSNIVDAKPSISHPQPPKPSISQPQPPVNITIFLESFA